MLSAAACMQQHQQTFSESRAANVLQYTPHGYGEGATVEFQCQAGLHGVIVGCSSNKQRLALLVPEHLTLIQDLDTLLARLTYTGVVLVAIQDAELQHT